MINKQDHSDKDRGNTIVGRALGLIGPYL